MSEEFDPKKTAEKYMEQMARLAKEAGQAIDKAMNIMDASSREMVDKVSQETKGHAQEMKRLSKEIVGEVRGDLPKVRAELKDMEARAREKLREMRGP
jgi:glycerate-2-kinase